MMNTTHTSNRVVAACCLSLLVASSPSTPAAPPVEPSAEPAAPARTTLSDPAMAYTVAEQPFVVLKRGPLQIVVVDNRAADDPHVLPAHFAGYSGLGSLTHERQARNLFKSNYGGLNFEHIHDGTTLPEEILFEPRRAPMQLRVINETTAELYQASAPY